MQIDEKCAPLKLKDVEELKGCQMKDTLMRYIYDLSSKKFCLSVSDGVGGIFYTRKKGKQKLT